MRRGNKKREGKIKQTYNFHYKIATSQLWLNTNTAVEVSTNNTSGTEMYIKMSKTLKY